MNIRKFSTQFLVAAITIISMSAGTSALAQVANPNANVEAQVREYFKDIPVMSDIAKCETSFRQFKSNGEALFDASGMYIGIFQINERTHIMTAWAQGFNLYTVEGNMGYAKYLYSKSGTAPWKGCLKDSAVIVPSSETIAPIPATPPLGSISLSRTQVRDGQTTGGVVTRNLRIGMTNTEVKILQQLLNANGFIIASAGPGSPGSETTTFGQLTREAVRKFQCAKQIVCAGDEATTGYGRIGPATRAALAQLVK